MAQILEQKEIDRTLACFSAIAKIQNNYLRTFGMKHDGDLTKGRVLRNCLNDFIKVPSKNSEQNVFVGQCKDILNLLDRRRK